MRASVSPRRPSPAFRIRCTAGGPDRRMLAPIANPSNRQMSGGSIEFSGRETVDSAWHFPGVRSKFMNLRFAPFLFGPALLAATFAAAPPNDLQPSAPAITRLPAEPGHTRADAIDPSRCVLRRGRPPVGCLRLRKPRARSLGLSPEDRGRFSPGRFGWTAIRWRFQGPTWLPASRSVPRRRSLPTPTPRSPFASSSWPRSTNRGS